MPITIELPANVETWLAGLAERRGTTPAAEAAAVIVQAAGATFDEVLAPFRRGFAASGVTEEELSRLVEEARQEMWDEKHRPGHPS